MHEKNICYQRVKMGSFSFPDDIQRFFIFVPRFMQELSTFMTKMAFCGIIRHLVF